MALTLGVAAMVCVTLLGIAWFLSDSNDLLIRSKRRHRLLVTLKSGESFDGVLLRTDRRTFVLVQAQAVTRDARHDVDGELVLARADVAYMQQT